MDQEAIFNRLQAVKERVARQADNTREQWQELLLIADEITLLQRQVIRELEKANAVGSAK